MKRGIVYLFLFLSLKPHFLGQEKFRRLPPYPEPVAAWQLPELETAVLSNGLTVAVVPRKNAPFLCLQLLITAGESVSPEGLPGAATLTARLLPRGTYYLSATDIEDKIEAIGGELNILVSFDRTLFSFRFLDGYLDEALSLLSQMILQPSLSSSELDAVRRSVFYDLLEKSADPDFIAQRQLLRWLFQGHPYAKALFNEDALRSIERRHVQDFYARYYRPENAVLVLGGNINLSLATRRVSHYFNIWKKEGSSLPTPPLLAPREEKLIGFVDFPRAKEVTVAMGNVLSSRATTDIFPFLVLNQVLGASPHSRLFMNLRETRQLAYMAFSEVQLHQHGWVFIIQAKFPPTALEAGLKEIERELNRLVEEKIPTAEVEQAKSYLASIFPLDLEPLEAMTRRAAEVLAFRLENDHWNRWSENILTLEANRVSDIAHKYFDLPFSTVVVGDIRLVDNFLQNFDQIRVFDRKGQFLYTISKGTEK